MIVVGVVVAAVAAFVISSAYYAVATPVERRVLGASAIGRGRPRAWKVLTELLRTAVVAGVFAWIAARAELASLPGSRGLAAQARLDRFPCWPAALTSCGPGPRRPPPADGKDDHEQHRELDGHDG